jgi:hypothetical protein
MISHAKLLQLIGEIDEISLEHGHGNEISVYITVGGEKIRIIRECNNMVDNYVTRYGIADFIHSGGIL